MGLRCLSPAPPPLPGSRWLWRNRRESAKLELGPRSKQGEGTRRLIALLPTRWVLCPRYHITTLFNKEKYKQHQAFWKAKDFIFCCLQGINKNGLIKSKAAQLDRASRKKMFAVQSFNFHGSSHAEKICLQLLMKR